MSVVVCPHCSAPTAPGRFCESCGQRLPSEDKPPQTEGGANAGNPEARDPGMPPAADNGARTAAPPPLPTLPKLPEFPKLPDPPGASELPKSPKPPVSPESPKPTPRTSPGPLAVECSLPERLVEGMTCALLFRLRSEGRDMECAELSLVEGDRVLAGPASHRGILGLRGAEIPLNVRAGQSGCLAVELRIECRRAGATEPERWIAPLTLLVEPSSPSGASPLTINVHNTGDLAEISLGSLADRLGAAASPGDRLGALADPRAFRPVDGLRLAASPSRLTLALPDGGRIHLVARRPAWFGRQGERPDKGRVRDNAVVLRATGSDGRSLDPDATRRLSRTHFLIEPSPSGAGCAVREGAPRRDPDGNILPGGVVAPSAGLAVDGERLPPFGGAVLSPGVEHSLVLSPDAREGGALALRVTALADAAGRTAGALVRRADAVPGRVLLVWGEIDLGVVDGALRGTSVLWDGARFLAVGPDGTDLSLAPGRAFGPPSLRCRIETFRQTSL